MSTNDEKEKGICILSFDSGGPGTYSQLLILKEYMVRLANDLGVGEGDVYPADYFDLMGGVGFGGLVAIMLGHLRMNVDEAIDALITVATTVFAEGSQDVADPETNSGNLKEAIDEMLQIRKVPVSTKMYERGRPQTICKVVLYAATSNNLSHPQAFRTYSHRGASLNPTIVEAVCATMSIPSLFSPVKIGPRLRQQSFIGGAFGANNPTRELLNEASAIFGQDKRVAQILSIGSGLSRVLSIDSLKDGKTGHRSLADIVADCETVARELAARLYNVDVYLRLNVDRGMEAVTNADWGELGGIESHTNAYIGVTAVTQSLDTSLRRLWEETGVVTLGQLNQSSSRKITAKTAPSVSPHFVLRIKEWEILVWHLVTSPCSRRQLPLPAEELKSAHTLLKELGCLAVALVQAGTYCHELSISFTQYLSFFKSHRAELMKRPEPSSLDSYERGAYTTLDLSYTALPQVAREFLRFISFFHHTDIPLAAFATAAEYGFKDAPSLLSRPDSHNGVVLDLKRLLCADGKWSEMQVQDTLCTLRSFSLLSMTSIGENVFLQLHPLIQAWLRDMDSSTSRHYRLMAVHIITSCRRNDAFPTYRHLIPHILDILDQQKGEELHINDLMAAGEILQQQGHYQAAEGVFETALEVIKKTRKPVMESTVASWLARVYRYQGRWIEAEKLLVEALEQMRRILGMEHSASIRVAVGLASTYRDQRRWNEAEKLQVEMLELWRRTVGREHPDAIIAAGNLALIYHAQGRWSEAEKLQVEMLELGRSILGREHLDTIQAAANLALTYHAQGRWSEAEKVEVEVLEQRKRILGNEHPDTITSAANLASTYRAQGRWSEAEKVGVEVLEQMKRVLGMEHPGTIITAGNLALTYRAQGRWSEAEKVGVEVLEQRKRILGNEHPDTITSAANLASTYRAQGRWSEAEKVEVEVLEQRKRILGNEHPDTITAAANLAATYGKQGRWEEQAALLAHAVRLSLKVLGLQHPHTQDCLRGLVLVYDKLGKEKEAQETRDQLIS